MRRHFAIVTMVWVVLTVAGLILANTAFQPAVASDKGQVIDDTFRTLLIMSVPVFTFVIAALGYSMIAFRHRGQPDEDGPPITGRGPIPLGWFVVTSIMALGVMVYPGLTELPTVVHIDAQPDVVVRIQGQQWQWSLSYPQSGAKSNTELVLPVDKKIGFEITSIDVIHSVWIPAFRMRIDAVPGLTTYMSFTPTSTGSYTQDSGLRLQCSQLCGLNHAQMMLPVRVVTDARVRGLAQDQHARRQAGQRPAVGDQRQRRSRHEGLRQPDADGQLDRQHHGHVREQRPRHRPQLRDRAGQQRRRRHRLQARTRHGGAHGGRAPAGHVQVRVPSPPDHHDRHADGEVTMTTAAAGAVPATRPSVISGFFPIFRGLLFAVIGFAIGAALACCDPRRHRRPGLGPERDLEDGHDPVHRADRDPGLHLRGARAG